MPWVPRSALGNEVAATITQADTGFPVPQGTTNHLETWLSRFPEGRLTYFTGRHALYQCLQNGHNIDIQWQADNVNTSIGGRVQGTIGTYCTVQPPNAPVYA